MIDKCHNAPMFSPEVRKVLSIAFCSIKNVKNIYIIYEKII